MKEKLPPKPQNFSQSPVEKENIKQRKGQAVPGDLKMRIFVLKLG